MNIAGELLDLEAGGRLDENVDAIETSNGIIEELAITTDGASTEVRIRPKVVDAGRAIQLAEALSSYFDIVEGDDAPTGSWRAKI